MGNQWQFLNVIIIGIVLNGNPGTMHPSNKQENHCSQIHLKQARQQFEDHSRIFGIYRFGKWDHIQVGDMIMIHCDGMEGYKNWWVGDLYKGRE